MRNNGRVPPPLARAQRSDGVAVRAHLFGTQLATVTSEWFLSGFDYHSSRATRSSSQVRVPELIFGTLLTGSNYDDERDLTTGGRNG